MKRWRFDNAHPITNLCSSGNIGSSLLRGIICPTDDPSSHNVNNSRGSSDLSFRALRLERFTSTPILTRRNSNAASLLRHPVPSRVPTGRAQRRRCRQEVTLDAPSTGEPDPAMRYSLPHVESSRNSSHRELETKMQLLL